VPAIVQIKRSSANTQPQSLHLGALAYSWANGSDKLFIGTGSDIGGGIASNIAIIGGKYFTDKLDHLPGTLVANSAVIVDAQGRINNMLMTNLNVDGTTTLSGTISINGNLDIGGNVTFKNFTANNIVARQITVDNLNVSNPISSLEVDDLTVSGTFTSDDITSQTVNVLGNLNVIGALTNLFTEELNIADNIIVLNSNLSPNTQPTQSSGFTVNRGIQENVSFIWDEVIDRWSVGSKGITANTFYGRLDGNSATANTLAVPVTISLANTVTGSVLFDGSRNVTIQTQINVINGGTY
jgi:hypothetical protein